MKGDILFLQKDLPFCPKGRMFKEDVSGGYYHSLTDNEAINNNFKNYKFTSNQMKSLMGEWFDIKRRVHWVTKFEKHTVTGKGDILAISLSENDLELDDISVGDIVYMSVSSSPHIIIGIEMDVNSMGHNDNIGLLIKKHIIMS
jgi:hypothetical protein